MGLLAILFFAWVGCWLWAMLRSDYTQFIEDETTDKDDDDYNDPDSWGT